MAKNPVFESAAQASDKTNALLAWSAAITLTAVAIAINIGLSLPGGARAFRGWPTRIYWKQRKCTGSMNRTSLMCN
jgi:hypothetical protein